ncbi:hypothetical protein CA606_09185 [Caulobacter vibrioides]|uniref:Uncharacterized protein n=1 Tax=Caulobacter vibrioides TaxID=155892 RepID=A0A290MU77_CAUVI|nr:hypothetical protein CA606_09185 [Caulobacter vibrioides]
MASSWKLWNGCRGLSIVQSCCPQFHAGVDLRIFTSAAVRRIQNIRLALRMTRYQVVSLMPTTMQNLRLTE